MFKKEVASICIILSVFTAYVGLKAVITRHVGMGSSGRGTATQRLVGQDAVDDGVKWLIATALLLVAAFLIWRFGGETD